MIVYQATKSEFVRDCKFHEIEEIILEHFVAATGHKVSVQEQQAWKASLDTMSNILSHDEIPEDAGVSVEFHIPQSSKRVDLILTGYGDDEEQKKNVVIVELKQWSKAETTKKDAIVLTHLGKGLKEVVHPSYQAWSYAALLEGFNEAVYDKGIQLQPCAYLHNYVSDGKINSDHYADYIAKAPLFLKGSDQKASLRSFIKQHIRRGDSGKVLQELDTARIRPSKALADSLSKLIKGNNEFVLIDDQKTVYESSLAAADKATDAKPRVVIIEGGPGTGKTVVAINLLVALTARGLNGKYVSKNAAPRTVYEAKLTGTLKKSQFSNMFTGSGAFLNATPNSNDFLVVDEAHRLNEKSGLFGNLGENQIKEIIESAKCSIFFLDEDQRVTLQDIGSKQRIEDFAKSKGAEVEHYQLSSQFRCSGSDGYMAWLDHSLQIRQTANVELGAGPFEFRVYDDPEVMHAAIADKNVQNKARVVAGYCWPWRSKKNSSEFDLEIGPTYKRRWNLSDYGSLWIIAPESVQEVGCIHTCQGLEVDYIGVIFGEDLIIRDGKVVTNPSARDRHDKSLKGWKSWMKSAPQTAAQTVDLIIKNTYRTLMTRGMKGCFVYSVDEETRQYFKDRAGQGTPT